jgi:DNA polymerase IV
MPALAHIVHLDADAFFVACELTLRPELRGTPCAVGGRERGIISSASYEARARGVYTPMPTSRALQICPDLVLLPHTPGLYTQLSRAMFERCEALTPLVQRGSIDEGYLDLSPCGLRDAEGLATAARALQQRIWAELALPVSFGLATNKLVAQIASKLRKPLGFVVVPPGAEAAFVAPLDLGRLPGIGTKTQATLKAQGLATVGDLLLRPEAELALLFGATWRTMVANARGQDERSVEPAPTDPKSYSQQETFEVNLMATAEIERRAQRMLDELLPQIRADGKRARTLTLKVRYRDFTQGTAAHTLAEASDLEVSFQPLIPPLLRQAWTKTQPLRLVGVRFSGLEVPATQLQLFGGEAEEKRRRLATVLDRLNAGGHKLRVRHGGLM